MTLKQIQKLDYPRLVYSQFVCTTVLYKRTPYRCLYYKSESNAVTLIILSRTQTGSTVTRHMKFDSRSAEYVIEKLTGDFNIMAEKMDGDLSD